MNFITTIRICAKYACFYTVGLTACHNLWALPINAEEFAALDNVHVRIANPRDVNCTAIGFAVVERRSNSPWFVGAWGTYASIELSPALSELLYRSPV